MSDVTQILSRIEAGDQRSADELLPLVYDELRTLAAARLASEPPGQTLDATALVHEAYLRLVDVRQAQDWNSRGHFFGAAAEAMRRILVDRARQKQSLKRGGQSKLQRVDVQELPAPIRHEEVLEVDAALKKLAAENPPIAKLVVLRYFGGLTLKEAAQALAISQRTASRYWVYAKAWLLQEIRESRTG